MNFLTQLLHLVGSGASAYITAYNLRHLPTRPTMLAGFQLAESGSVPFLEALAERAEREGDRWLSERLTKHAQDERRHGQIFAQALKQLNKQAIDFSKMPEQTDENSSDRRSPFFDAYFANYTREQLSPQNMDWTVFFASTYILELDASRDFVRMARVFEGDAVNGSLNKGLLSIAQDETGHARYLKEAMERRLSYNEVNDLIDEWRTRKVNALLAMVRNLMEKGGKMASLATDGVPAEMSEGMAEAAEVAV
ncbi:MULTISPECIES: ferritin-like domain-containing protein [unclassified Leptolyngbya]|uniref:ferritin-like domain-containing protein n=1 Tax=unclassified Leptolyngbya TaxID=2650499 RepID=UPI001681D529|nr:MULTISPECIES: ferritin-like domain-containing protein [unclassified Leptolyngbya]MBD1910481.1 ferritin-like domain-containing protein [Leptolyngbya sp. FACHB-8]MBD2153648.1 ferritin-like domain-containing protein [Leptolyngbya sp. FACHB-16]